MNTARNNIGYSLRSYIKNKATINVSPGPTQIPRKVLEKLNLDLSEKTNNWEFGVTPLEISHRSPEFLHILNNLNTSIRSFMKIPDDFSILWTQGGGHGQFSAVPLNMLGNNLKNATYIVTGTWSERAAKEASKYLNVNKVSINNNNAITHTELPDSKIISTNDDYLYLCSNETVNGLEYIEKRNPIPNKHQLKNTKTVVDMSSDFLTKSVNWNNIDVAFACSSKNMGTAGSTITIVKKDLLNNNYYNNYFPIPSILDWKLYHESDSLYNTPNIFSIYLMNELINFYINEYKNIEQLELINKAKANLIYETLEKSSEFSLLVNNKHYQSRMNIPFFVNNMNKFLEYSYLNNIVGLRTKTPFQYKEFNMDEPLRISLYNGITINDTIELSNILQKYKS
jgi:phosphoserine aminotransferase